MKSNETEELIISILTVIIGLIMAFTAHSCRDSGTEDVWNNGICQECEIKYELRGVAGYGLKYYVCPECGKEVERYSK